MKIHYLFFTFAFLTLIACSGNSAGTLDSPGDSDLAQFAEETLVGTFAQNGSGSGSSQTSDGGSNGDAQDNSGEGGSNHLHGEGGKDGIFIVDGRLVIKGEPPQLGSDCDGAVLAPGSTETAGRIIISNPKNDNTENPRCTIRFNKPYQNPVCVVSGLFNNIAVSNALGGTWDKFIISKVGGGKFVTPDQVNYICLDLVKPPPDQSGSSGSGTFLDASKVQGVLPQIQGQSQGKEKNDPLKEYCLSELEECKKNLGADGPLCDSNYNACLNKTDCETLNTACLHVGTSVSQCDQEKADCEKKVQCEEAKENCLEAAQSGEGVQMCNMGYFICLSS